MYESMIIDSWAKRLRNIWFLSMASCKIKIKYPLQGWLSCHAALPICCIVHHTQQAIPCRDPRQQQTLTGPRAPT